ncbi:MAG: hypothetical protein NTY67_11980 [Cyanobacteria bacterium]|nr:hypothetical protein [Cyanobacteriota bacterium]
MAILASSGKSGDDYHCPADHAGYYENDGKGIDRLVICKCNVPTNPLTSCSPAPVRQRSLIGTDELMQRTYRELQTMAPHYAK